MILRSVCRSGSQAGVFWFPMPSYAPSLKISPVYKTSPLWRTARLRTEPFGRSITISKQMCLTLAHLLGSLRQCHQNLFVVQKLFKAGCITVVHHAPSCAIHAGQPRTPCTWLCLRAPDHRWRHGLPPHPSRPTSQATSRWWMRPRWDFVIVG